MISFGQLPSIGLSRPVSQASRSAQFASSSSAPIETIHLGRDEQASRTRIEELIAGLQPKEVVAIGSSVVPSAEQMGDASKVYHVVLPGRHDVAPNNVDLLLSREQVAGNDGLTAKNPGSAYHTVCEFDHMHSAAADMVWSPETLFPGRTVPLGINFTVKLASGLSFGIPSFRRPQPAAKAASAQPAPSL